MNEYSSFAAGPSGRDPSSGPATAGENARRGPPSPRETGTPRFPISPLGTMPVVEQGGSGNLLA
ncbi:MAG: hypothetical protein ACLQVG_09795 [Terriglobia bacterium]